MHDPKPKGSSAKSRMDANMQLPINIFGRLFPDKIFFPDTSLTFSKISDISLTADKFPDISRFSIPYKWSP